MESRIHWKVLTATKQEHIPGILDFVHDRPYDLSSLKTDNGGVLVLEVRVRTEPSGLFRRRGVVSTRMIISGVTSFAVDDRAEIGIGDICDIVLLEHEVRVLGSLPVDIHIKAVSPEIKLLLPENAFFA